MYFYFAHPFEFLFIFIFFRLHHDCLFIIQSLWNLIDLVFLLNVILFENSWMYYTSLKLLLVYVFFIWWRKAKGYQKRGKTQSFITKEYYQEYEDILCLLFFEKMKIDYNSIINSYKLESFRSALIVFRLPSPVKLHFISKVLKLK